MNKPNDALYPEETWLQYASPGDAGYSPERLANVRDYFEQIGSSALLVIHDGTILLAAGQVNRRFECRSIRKSFLSALYGIYVGKGTIDLNRTLADLDIDDEPPLTEGEKEARVEDLLKSRSGIYHLAAFEAQDEKPTRGCAEPDERWYYNNWDFNTLLTIFEQETDTRFFEEFERHVAIPLQMEEFRLRDTCYHFERDRSIHPAYRFRMSAKDMARFGLLYLRQGQWKDRQIIPRKWVTKSTTSYSSQGEDGYGYMWWVYDAHMPGRFRRFYELGMYEASGTGGQRITILPRANLVIVHLRDTYVSDEYDSEQVWTLYEMLFDARAGAPLANPSLIPFKDPPKWFETVSIESHTLDRYIGDYEFEDGIIMTVEKENDALLVKNLSVWSQVSPSRLFPISETAFILEDVGYVLTFNPGGKLSHVAMDVAPDRTHYGRLKAKRR